MTLNLNPGALSELHEALRRQVRDEARDGPAKDRTMMWAESEATWSERLEEEARAAHVEYSLTIVCNSRRTQAWIESKHKSRLEKLVGAVETARLLKEVNSNGVNDKEGAGT